MQATAEYTVRDQDLMSRARRYFEWQYRLAGKQLGPRILEVGCGAGNFTEHLLSHNWVTAIDIEPGCIALHRARFAGVKNLTSHCMDVLSPDFLRLREDRPDSIACLNMLEHVEDDAAALANMHAVLPGDGRAVLIVPAFQSLYGPVDERLGHYRRYTKRSLTGVAQKAGFRTVDVRLMNSFGFFGWWFNAHVAQRKEQSPVQIAIFDMLVVPWLSRLEALKEPPVGLSLFAVLRK